MVGRSSVKKTVYGMHKVSHIMLELCLYILTERYHHYEITHLACFSQCSKSYI